jgi:glucosamine--fructose-6-phosphate aminotransferase (isomerizing)
LSNSNNNEQGQDTSHTPGAYSLAEILSQPTCWSTCLADLQQAKKLQKVVDSFAGAADWLFIGCGSSYYVALSAAATMTSLTSLRARAAPASELLLYPNLVLAGGKSVHVLISRSGQTSEVVAAAELLKARGIRTLAITCAVGQPLESVAAETIIMSAADEKSTVMTRAFSSMLLALQVLAGTIARDSGFIDSLHAMPEAVASLLESLPARIRDFVAAHRFADYVYLGQGPFYGLAREGALKVTEMSVSYAQSFHTLEFRHGPKSIVEPETLLVFLLSESAYQAERETLEEMKSLGATTLVVANRADARARAASDLLVELSLDVPELARLAPYLFAGQLLGLYTGLKKGFDPDSPRNLSRVVLLDEEESRKKPEHAAFDK